MRTVNFYVIYREETRINGGVSAEFTAIAESEKQVREMAEEQGIDLDGYTIECTREDVRDQLRRPYAPCFRAEWE